MIGIEKLRNQIIDDCKKGQNCFNENGCDKEYTKIVPQDNPNLLKYSETKCIRTVKCFHQYCDKYKWITDRAKHYAEKTGKTIEEIINIWEEKRSYWYMNYYQDANQPLLDNKSIIDYDLWINQLKEKFGEEKNWKFKCPVCGNIQSIQDFIDAKIENPKQAYFNCIGRYIKNKGCDYTLGGLLTLNKISIFKDGIVYPVFELA